MSADKEFKQISLSSLEVSLLTYGLRIAKAKLDLNLVLDPKNLCPEYTKLCNKSISAIDELILKLESERS